MFDSSEQKEFVDGNFKFDITGRQFFQTGRKHWDEEKLLISSNFSFSHRVFKRHVKPGLFWQRVKNVGLLCEKLNACMQ